MQHRDFHMVISYHVLHEWMICIHLKPMSKLEWAMAGEKAFRESSINWLWRGCTVHCTLYRQQNSRSFSSIIQPFNQTSFWYSIRHDVCPVSCKSYVRFCSIWHYLGICEVLPSPICISIPISLSCTHRKPYNPKHQNWINMQVYVMFVIQLRKMEIHAY